MWRPRRRTLALSVLGLAIPFTALVACPSTRTPAIPPGTALVETSTPSEAIPEPPADAANAPTRLAIRRVDQCVVPPVPSEDGGTIAMDADVRYGPDERQVLDIAWPTTPSRGVVVIIHGGGWTADQPSRGNAIECLHRSDGAGSWTSR